MRKQLIDHGHPRLSLRCQSHLLGVNRNRLRSAPTKLSLEDLEICAEIDRIHMTRPYYGSRRMGHELRVHGFAIGRGRTRRLKWMTFYNQARPHQSHGNQTPWSVWLGEHLAPAA